MDPLVEGAKLAEILKNSNVPEVKQLAESFLALDATYQTLRDVYVKKCSDYVLLKHRPLLERLKDLE